MGATLNLAYIVLAHETPAVLAPLVSTLQHHASVVVHYDAKCPAKYREELQSLTPEPIVFADAVDVRWGEWSLVKATLNGLYKLRELNSRFDYVCLLSGSCFPVKPLADFESHLAANIGSEFIESCDVSRGERWVIDGLQEERWSLYHFLNWRTHPRAYDFSVKVQRKMGINRLLPAGLEPRMGSQWWTLTWSSLEEIIAYYERENLEEFFSRTWIPDEYFFQSLLQASSPGANIQNTLMHYKFDDLGQPYVYYDDDYALLAKVGGFFARKVSPDAKRLKNDLRELALGNGSMMPAIVDEPTYHSQVTVPTFRLGKNIDDAEWLLNHAHAPICVVMAENSELGQKICAEILAKCAGLLYLGQPFAAEEISFAASLPEMSGYSRTDVALRDENCSLFLLHQFAAGLREDKAGLLFSVTPEDTPFEIEDHAWNSFCTAVFAYDNELPGVYQETLNYFAAARAGSCKFVSIDVSEENYFENIDKVLYHLSESISVWQRYMRAKPLSSPGRVLT